MTPGTVPMVLFHSPSFAAVIDSTNRPGGGGGATEEIDLGLPQPCPTKAKKERDSQKYRYIRNENIGILFRQQELCTDNEKKLSPFVADQLVWVCQSKGLKKKQSKTKSTNANDDNNNNDDDRSNSNNQRLELFLRARVVNVDEQQEGSNHRRIRVRYPRGSTYACRPTQLIPILTPNLCLNNPVIVVTAETCDYRRACVVHTLPNEVFVEVGCDYGATVDRVYRTGIDANHLMVPVASSLVEENNMANPVVPTVNSLLDRSQQKRLLLGIDKSSESIQIATSRYPHLKFLQWDLLEFPVKAEWPDSLQTLHPDVIAVDINGNRELDAVLQCLQVLMNAYQPRLFIVKSRTLHARIESTPDCSRD